MSAIVLRGGLLIDANPHVGDVLVVNGAVTAVGTSLDVPAGTRELDVSGCWVGPGFVDLHVHLREPGHDEAETIESGANAAALGGFTAIVAMPNTEPALDNVALVSYVLDRGKGAPVDVAVAGAITLGRQGERLAPMGELAGLGVRLFTDDGTGVQDPALMRRALAYAKPLGVRLAQHCEDERLAAGGTMNEGALSGRLGLVGRPALAEELMVMRDIELVRLTGAAVHFQHLSTARSIALAVAARDGGLDVTFEVAPHHFTLDESACATFDPIFKVHPPLRPASDVRALRVALRAGAVDAVASDHAPHAPETKDLAFDEAPPGMLGLEHAAALTYEALGSDDCDPRLFFGVMSRGPARVAQLRVEDHRPRHSAHGGSLSPGEDANLVVFDPSERWVATSAELHSKARNSPYDGRVMRGRVRHTISRGALVVDGGTLA